MDDRRFATSRERLALWCASGGFCAMCGEAIGPDFHADHIKPWSVTKTTNVHEMQALCPTCNMKKGALMLRSHQQDALRIANDVGIGVTFRKVLASVTPGGGKSVLPVIFAERMLSRRAADKICWVVPRDSLRTQAERSFLDNNFRNQLSHSREIRSAENEPDPSRDKDGYVTTYQAVASFSELHAQEFRRHRYVLVLDEIHHVQSGSTWHRALQKMVDQAALVVLLSGTLSRADGKQIAFVNYELDASGRSQAVTTDTDDMRVVRYSRANALAEQAVLPLYFERVDGNARWLDGTDEKEVSSLAGAGEDTSGALYTALRQEYATDLLREAIGHWRHYTEQHPRSKFLVVAPNIALAKSYLARCREIGVTDVEIATSEDSDEAKQNINRLKGHRKPPLRGLVTVGMAYEGLDCPEITHIACLTHIRSHEWIEQMLARATRVDYKAGPYVEQAAYVWAPDDDLFSEAVAKIQAEQATIIAERLTEQHEPSLEDAARDVPLIIPLGAESTTSRAMDMQTGEVVDGAGYKRIKEVMEAVGIRHVSPLQMQKALDLLNATPAVGTSWGSDTTPSTPDLTASEREAKFRKELDAHVRRTASQAGTDIGETIKTINKAIIKTTGKHREQMNEAELQRAFEIVNDWARRIGGVRYATAR